jgi:hypothetical protein
MDELQHPDSIWTWSSSGRKSKASLWIPYLQSVTKVKGAKGHWKVTFNGGEFQFDLDKVEVILFYGASGDLPLTFLDELAAKRIPALFHRRKLHLMRWYTPLHIVLTCAGKTCCMARCSLCEVIYWEIQSA